jgi:hypothetical protein
MYTGIGGLYIKEGGKHFPLRCLFNQVMRYRYLLIVVVHCVGVIDFDAETADDPQQHGEYAMETFQYYKVNKLLLNPRVRP